MNLAANNRVPAAPPTAVRHLTCRLGRLFEPEHESSDSLSQVNADGVPTTFQLLYYRELKVAGLLTEQEEC
jgi:hypothetical protein